MPAVLQNIIPLQSYEVILPKIVTILQAEFDNQAELISEFVSPTIVQNRYTSIDGTEPPIINVRFRQGDMFNKDRTDRDGDYEYWIDVYTQADNEDNVDAYDTSATLLFRYLGMAAAILSNQAYTSLTLTSKIVKSTQVKSIIIGTKQDMQDALSSMVGRIVFKVVAYDTTEVATPQDLEMAVAIMKLTDTVGYKSQIGS